MDGDDLELFERVLRGATETATGAELDRALDALEWRDALRAEPRAAISVLFERQGAAGAASSALDAVVLDALGLDRAGAVVWPALGGYDAPGKFADGRLVVRGLGSTATAGGETVTVVASGDGAEWRATTVPTVALTVRRVQGLDPGAGLAEISGEIDAGEATTVGWDEAVRRARLALSHELIGASRSMLEMARLHALERIQFGVPIASFQAVRHRLAETLVAIEAANAAADAAWLDESTHHAAIAKSLAGRGARTAARHCQQVLAGIGFTKEHPFHRYLRRVVLLDELFGSSRLLTRELGEQVLAAGELPPLLPL
ncbi:MAG: hypothetical protein QOJ00_1001 [Actinomycetota bacterium]